MSKYDTCSLTLGYFNTPERKRQASLSPFGSALILNMILGYTLHHIRYYTQKKKEKRKMGRIESDVNEGPIFGHLTNLSPEKLGDLETLLKSILALPVARETYAQIIDGTPIRTPYSEDIKALRSRLRETIIVNDNSKPSDQAMQLYEEIRTKFAPQTLKIDLKVRTPP